jgi:hypothetical protein
LDDRQWKTQQKEEKEAKSVCKNSCSGGALDQLKRETRDVCVVSASFGRKLQITREKIFVPD